MRLPKKIWLFGLPAVLLVGFAVLGVSYVKQRETVAAQQRMIEAQTESAYRALSDDLYDLSVALSKMEAASTPARLSKGLAEVRRLSADAARALSLLPANYGDNSGLMQFFTRAGDYAETLMDRVLNGQMLTADQQSSLDDLRACCADLSKSYDGDCQNGSFPPQFTGDEGFYGGEQNEENLAQYPSLLYDGPFSESSEQANPQGLSGGSIDEAEAMRIAEELFPDRSLESDGRTQGTIPTFDFSANDGQGELCISITEQGGALYYFMGEPSGSSDAPPSDEESERLHRVASAFLAEHGYGEMEPSYAQYYAGTVVLNYAALQNGVILYADLVKVYVDRDAETVIGLDAQNYCFHHRTRHVAAPELSEQDAIDRISDALTLESVRLALIPKCNTVEVLCYECKCEKDGVFYIVYINAATGAEEEIFEVINSDEGDLVV